MTRWLRAANWRALLSSYVVNASSRTDENPGSHAVRLRNLAHPEPLTFILLAYAPDEGIGAEIERARIASATGANRLRDGFIT